jgi:MFS family permease
MQGPDGDAAARRWRAFLVVWAGQLVSVTGTALTGFGLQVWTYLETGSVTRLALVSLAYALPAIALSPVAGVLADRLDRRLAMLAADVLAGIATLAIAILHFTGSLQLWHVYALIGLGAIGNTLQVPAWMASLPLLVPKKHLGRANGLVMTTEAVSIVVAPAAAGALLATRGLGAILLTDVATFAVAVVTLALVRFPRPEPTAAPGAAPSMWREMAAGWHYLRARRGLLGLLFIYAGVNFVLSFENVLAIPLIVSLTSEAAAGGVLSAAGFGMLAGSLAVSAWGGPKRRRIAWIMGGIAVSGGAVFVIGLRPWLWLIAGAYVLLALLGPVINTSSQVVWQLKVAPGMQGRVFALRRMLAQMASPLAIILAGPLADRVFEPMLAADGALAGSVGRLIGTGPGRGIAFLFLLTGVGTALLAAVGWLSPRVRHVETEIPDQIPDAPAPAEAAGNP